MTLTLTAELEQAIGAKAQKQGMTTEETALTALRERFLPASPAINDEDALSEWEQMMQAAAAQIAAAQDGEHAGLAALEKEQA